MGLDIKVGAPADGSGTCGAGDGHGGPGELEAAAAPPRGSSCRGLQLRDRARCFRAAALILHIAMRDKVLPVVFAAHELYRLAFEHGLGCVAEDEANHAMSC